MSFTSLAYITTSNGLVIVALDYLTSSTMFLASSFSALCSLLTLLGSVEAQSSSLSSSAAKPPASSSASPSLVTESYPTSSPVPTVSPPTATSGFSIIGNVLKPTITSYTFNPFPAPSEISILNVFPETYPDDPPSVDDRAIPNFGPAWAAAYSKARTRVGGFLASPVPLLLPFNSHAFGRYRFRI